MSAPFGRVLSLVDTTWSLTGKYSLFCSSVRMKVEKHVPWNKKYKLSLLPLGSHFVLL